MSDAPYRGRSGEHRLEQELEFTTVALEGTLRLAARALGVDRCVLGLVSPRDSWMRTIIGVAPNEARSFLGLCSFAMMQDAVTVVPDTHAVGALAHLPPVRATDGYRWFVGAPLVAPSGAKRGGLAALHRTARPWSRDDGELFDMLCHQAVALVEQLRTIEELRRRAQHQAAVISTLRGVMKASTTVAIVATDLSGRIKLFSEGAEHMFGVTAREAVGRTIGFLLADRDRDAASPRPAPDPSPETNLFPSLVAGVGRDAPDEKTWLMRRADGSLFSAALAAACVTEDGGELAGYAFIARDVTEQRAVERMKDDFVSMVSHELRTPLTSILGALGLLVGDVAGPVSAPVGELIHIAHANSERLLRVVNDILDMQRLTSGRIDLVIEPVDLHAAARRAIELVQPLAAGRAIACALRREAPSGGVVEADFGRIVQVLVNLLSNAVRYSPPSSTVHVDLDDVASGVRVTVEDEGPGIPEAFQSRLFQKFARAASDASAPEGTGLGLSIVKAILDLHGGEVSFRPASPHGAVFYFELPRERPAPRSARFDRRS